MKASNTMMLAAATATSAQTLLNNTGDVAPSSSVSYLVAAYEQLSVSTAVAFAEPSTDAAQSLDDPALATPPAEVAADTAAALPATTPTAALAAESGLALAPTESAPVDAAILPAETNNAATAANLAAAETTQAVEGLPPTDLGSTTSLTTAFNTQAAGYTQESLALLPTVDSATRTYTVPAGLPTSYPSPIPLTTGTRYELSPDVDLLPTASLPTYVTTVTYTTGSSIFLSTVTSDCGNGTMVFPPSTQPPTLPSAPTTAPELPSSPPTPPPASYPTYDVPSSTYPLAPPPSEPTLSSSASTWTELPSTTLTEIPLTTLTMVTGTLTSYSTVVSNCGNGSMTHAPTGPSAPILPPTSIDIGPVMPSQPGAEPAPTEAPGLFPGLPTTAEPLPETPCSEATGEAPHPVATPAYTNVWSASEGQLSSPANPTQSNQFLPILNTTMATIQVPTPTSTTEDSIAPATTVAGGFSQGSGTADPGLFASAAPPVHGPSKIWVVLGALLAAVWMF